MSVHRLRPLTREEVRSVDRRAIDEYGMSGLVLMENAGRNAADVISHRVDVTQGVCIVCGKGNNAGDGFVIARHLELSGFDVSVVLVESPATYSVDARANYEIASRSGIQLANASEDVSQLKDALSQCDVIVDAIIGTGLKGNARVKIASAIDYINAAKTTNHALVVSIDIPSGMDCDVGPPAKDSRCVEADVTITFVARKIGFDKPASAAFLGEVIVVGIGAPAVLLCEYAE